MQNNQNHQYVLNWINSQKNFPVGEEINDTESQNISCNVENESHLVSSPTYSDSMSNTSSASSRSTASTPKAKWMQFLKVDKAYFVKVMDMKDPPTKKTVFKFLYDFQNLQATLFNYNIVRRGFVMSPEEQLLKVTHKQWKDGIEGIYNCLMMEALIRPMPSETKLDDFRNGVEGLRNAILAEIISESIEKIGVSNILNVGGSK